MKKLLSLVMAILLMATFSVSAFAAGTITDETAPQTVTVPAGGTTKEVPIYGYIGPDTDVTPGGTDPEDPPIQYGDTVAVSVPVKLIWASFATTNVNEINSPEYFIRNNSGKTNLNVSLTAFAGGAGASEFSSSVLKLNLAAVSGSPVAQADVLANPTKSFGTLPFGANNIWKFKITGTYTGSYDVVKTPAYSMTLRFDIAP